MSTSEPQDPKDPRVRYAGFERLSLLVTIQIGTHRCHLRHLAGLKPGEVMTLDQEVGSPFELRCSGVRLARVEPVAGPQGIGVKLVQVEAEEDDAVR